MHNGVPKDIASLQTAGGPRAELINKVLQDVATIYREVKPTTEEEAVIALSLLRMMTENAHDNRQDYPKALSMQNPAGFDFAYRITKPKMNPTSVLTSLTGKDRG